MQHHKSTAPRFQVASQVSRQQNRAIVSGLSGFRLGIFIDNVPGLGFWIDYLLHQLENGDQTNVGVSLFPTDSMSWHNPTQSYRIEFRDRNRIVQPPNNHGNINCYSSFFSSSSVLKPYTPCGLEYKYKNIKFWRCSKIKLCALWNSYSLCALWNSYSQFSPTFHLCFFFSLCGYIHIFRGKKHLRILMDCQRKN